MCGTFTDSPCILTLISAVPGVVSDLTCQSKFTSIVLTWSTPREPNRVIISYEVTYRVSDGNLVTTNTTDLRFTIPSLTSGTNVTEISVSAYTSVGRGDPGVISHLVATYIPRECTYYDCYYLLLHDYYNIHFVAPVVIQLEVLSATSVRVSWDRFDIPEITGYIVYYSQTMNSEMVPTQHFINVFSSTNFVLLTDLTSGAEYQFEVVAVAELDGDTVMGERSDNFTERLTLTSLPATQSNITPIIGGVMAFIVAVAFVAVVVVILLFFIRSRLGLLLPSHSTSEASF